MMHLYIMANINIHIKNDEKYEFNFNISHFRLFLYFHIFSTLSTPPIGDSLKQHWEYHYSSYHVWKLWFRHQHQYWKSSISFAYYSLSTLTHWCTRVDLTYTVELPIWKTIYSTLTILNYFYISSTRHLFNFTPIPMGDWAWTYTVGILIFISVTPKTMDLTLIQVIFNYFSNPIP